MNKIHKILGTPSDSAMAFFKKHQSRHMSFSWTPQKGTGFKSLIPHVPADFRDLLEGMLQYDPRKRISAHDAVRHKYFDDLWDTPLPAELQDQGGVKDGTRAQETAAASEPSSKKSAPGEEGLKVQSTSAAPVRGGLDSPESVRSDVQGGSKARPSGGGDSPVSEALGGADGKYEDEEFEESVASGSTPKHHKQGGGHASSLQSGAGQVSSVSTSLQLSGLKSLNARDSSLGESGKGSGAGHGKYSGGGMSYLSGGKAKAYTQSTHQHHHAYAGSQAALQPLSGSSLGESHSSSKGGSSAYLESLAGSGQKRTVGIKKITRNSKGGKVFSSGGGTAASSSSRSSTGGGGTSAADLAARHKQLMRKTRKGTVTSKVASKQAGGGSRLVPDTFTGGPGVYGGLGAIGGGLGASPSAATVGGGIAAYGARSSSYNAGGHAQSQPTLGIGGQMNLSIGGGFGASPKRAAGGSKYGGSALRQGGISTGALGLARRSQGAKPSPSQGAGAAGGSPLRSSGGGSYAAMGAVRSSSGVQGFNAGAASKYFGSGVGSSGYGGSGYSGAPKSSAGIGSSYHRAAGGAHRTVNLRLGAPKSSAGAESGTLGRLSGAPGSSAGIASKYRMR